jgi:hypothetical protein
MKGLVAGLTIVVLMAACGSEGGGATPTPLRGSTFVSEPAEVCAASAPSVSDDPLSVVVARWLAEGPSSPEFVLCIGRATGAVTGHVEAASKFDDGACKVGVHTSVSLSGPQTTVPGGGLRLSGTGLATSTYAVSGLCEEVRARYATATSAVVEWSGAISGPRWGSRFRRESSRRGS